MWAAFAMLAVLAAEPVRWLPVAFEQAAWVRQSPPELLTDLGRFQWDGSAWIHGPRKGNPIVPMLTPPPSAFLGDELLLAAHEAAVQLTDRGRRLFIVRRGQGAPVSIALPEVDGVRAATLRFLADLPNAWLVEGITTVGDAQLGIFMLRLAKFSRLSAFVKPAGSADLLPAFARGVAWNGAWWLLPSSGSDSQESWAWRAGGWERRAPPSPEAVLLDAFAMNDTLYLAYTNGIAVITAGSTRWDSLAAEVARPAWVCAAPYGAPVRGRWLRGEELIGWSVGTAEPTHDFPLDGTSCAFFTNAAAAQGLAAPTSVNISLTTGGTLPVMR